MWLSEAVQIMASVSNMSHLGTAGDILFPWLYPSSQYPHLTTRATKGSHYLQLSVSVNYSLENPRKSTGWECDQWPGHTLVLQES